MMDNASFHRSASVKKLCNEAGVMLQRQSKVQFVEAQARTASPRASGLQLECLLAFVTLQMQGFLSSDDAQCVGQSQHTAVAVCGLERRGDCQACCPLLRA
jgi:hypothetical protein